MKSRQFLRLHTERTTVNNRIYSRLFPVDYDVINDIPWSTGARNERDRMGDKEGEEWLLSILTVVVIDSLTSLIFFLVYRLEDERLRERQLGMWGYRTGMEIEIKVRERKGDGQKASHGHVTPFRL